MKIWSELISLNVCDGLKDMLADVQNIYAMKNTLMGTICIYDTGLEWFILSLLLLVSLSKALAAHLDACVKTL